MRAIWGVAFAAGMSVSTPAMAAEWVKIFTGDDGSYEYYDPASVTRTGKTVQYRTRSDYRDAEVSDDTPPISETLEEFDCAAGRLRPVDIVDYDADGRQAAHYDFHDEFHWIDVEDGSLAATKRDLICK